MGDPELIVHARLLERPRVPAGLGGLIVVSGLVALVAVIASMFIDHIAVGAVGSACFIGCALGLAIAAWSAMTALARAFAACIVVLCAMSAAMRVLDMPAAVVPGFGAFALMVVLFSFGIRSIRTPMPVVSGPAQVSMERWFYRAHVAGAQVAVELHPKELHFAGRERDVWRLEHLAQARLRGTELSLRDRVGDVMLLEVASDDADAARALVARLQPSQAPS
jgi:hypothetical protein